MVTSPVIVLTQPAAPGHDWFSLLIASLPTLGALVIFWFTVRKDQRTEAKRRAQQLQDMRDERERQLDDVREERELERQRDRNAYHLDLKRQVILDVAPAITNAYQSLGLMLNLDLDIEKANKVFAKLPTPMARLMAVASDETLDAAQPLMLAISKGHLRLLKARIDHAGESPDQLMDALVSIWKECVHTIPDLWATFLQCARSELDLEFDRDNFARGVKEAIAEQMALFDRMIAQARADH